MSIWPACMYLVPGACRGQQRLLDLQNPAGVKEVCEPPWLGCSGRESSGRADSAFLLFSIFEAGFLCPGTRFVDQSDFEFSEICLSLPPKCWRKGMQHRTQCTLGTQGSEPLCHLLHSWFFNLIVLLLFCFVLFFGLSSLCKTLRQSWSHFWQFWILSASVP